MHSDVGLTGKNRLDTLSDATLAARAEHVIFRIVTWTGVRVGLGMQGGRS
jgi:hypothetical protein